jgi:hypothetical protein
MPRRRSRCGQFASSRRYDAKREVALRRREATPFRGRAGFAGASVGKNRLRNTTDTIRLARWR